MYVQNPRKIKQSKTLCIRASSESSHLYTCMLWNERNDMLYYQKIYMYIYDMIPLVLELDAKKVTYLRLN